MGQKQQLLYFEQLVQKLDIDRQQVYVKARIIEVSDKKSREVGIKYGLVGSKEYSAGLASFTASLTKKAILPTIPLVNTDGNVVNSGVLAMGVSLNLLNQNGAADIVSEPSLLCLNNKSSSIYVGQTVSVKTAKTNGTSTTESFKREDIGLTLKVKPRISTGGKVLLEIETKIEDVTNPEGANNQPDTSKKELTTSAIVNDGESVILGGYTRNIHSKTVDKVPFFGDIPILGALFRNKSTTDDKINLVIIITPYIVPKTKDLTYIRNKLSKLKALEDDYTQKAINKLMMKSKIKEKIKQQKEEIDLHQKRVNELLGI